MAQETLSSAILIIAAIIATVALVNAVYPSLFASTSSIGSASTATSDRVKTDVRVVETSSPNATALAVWAKNVGSTEISASELAYSDVFFGGDRNSMARVSTDLGDPCHWSYIMSDTDGDGQWSPGETLEVLITDASGSHLAAGTHYVKLTLYNSASVEATVTI